MEPQDCIQAEGLKCTYLCQAGRNIDTSWLVNGISRNNSDIPTTARQSSDGDGGTIESLMITANQSYNESNITCQTIQNQTNVCGATASLYVQGICSQFTFHYTIFCACALQNPYQL